MMFLDFLLFESGKSSPCDPQTYSKTCFRPPLQELEEFCMQKIDMLQMPVKGVIGVMGFLDNVKISTFEKVKKVMSVFCAKNNFSPFGYFDFLQKLKCSGSRDTAEKVLYMVKK